MKTTDNSQKKAFLSEELEMLMNVKACIQRLTDSNKNLQSVIDIYQAADKQHEESAQKDYIKYLQKYDESKYNLTKALDKIGFSQISKHDLLIGRTHILKEWIEKAKERATQAVKDGKFDIVEKELKFINETKIELCNIEWILSPSTKK